jgi:hypothetical protein
VPPDVRKGFAFPSSAPLRSRLCLGVLKGRHSLLDPVVTRVEDVNVSDGESYCSEFRLQAASSVSPKFPPEGGTPKLLLILPFRNAAGRPGGAGCFHLFFQPREITFD